MRRSVLIAVLFSCGEPQLLPQPEPIVPATPQPEATTAHAPKNPERLYVPPAEPLKVEWLGVGGFLITRGDDAVMTPPLFTRPSLLQVNTGVAVHPDVQGTAARLPREKVKNVKAIFSGHAHYDHVFDMAAAQLNADQPVLYGNRSMKNLLAPLSGDRPASCPAAGPREVTLDASKVVALDAFDASRVDYRLCPAQRPVGAPLEGTWVHVPNSHVRFMSLCSLHNAQFGSVHFGEGHVETPQCELPTRMDAWKEGNTLAFLIDFLDPVTGQPTMRVYYQDSPGKDPVGYVPPQLLEEKQVDLAMLCVGNYDQVPNEPTRTLAEMKPRFALGGHWEDFFRDADSAPMPIPFLDVNEWQRRAQAALTGSPSGMTRNGQTMTQRALLPQPWDVYVVQPSR
jgi:hypothetical protein